MSTELRYYEVLGVSPGVSGQELKAAHRDLAKVWHPDRFGHDPRLQQKAQEKLKEINEAYDRLTSGKSEGPRASRRTSKEQYSAPPPTSQTDQATDRYSTSHGRARSRAVIWTCVVVPVLLFGAVFVVTSRSLLRTGDRPDANSTAQTDTQVEQPPRLTPVDATSPSSSDAARNRSRIDSGAPRESKPSTDPAVEPVAAQVRPLPTATVTIDPSTGLLARSDCPNRIRMTYPSGAEPKGYCNAPHPVKAEPAAAAPTKESRIKSFAKRVASPGKWFSGDDKKEKSGTSRQD